MCKGIDLDDKQKQTLKECLARAQDPQLSKWAKFRNGLTMVTLGMYAASSRIPDHYDENNKLF